MNTIEDLVSSWNYGEINIKEFIALCRMDMVDASKAFIIPYEWPDGTDRIDVIYSGKGIPSFSLTRINRPWVPEKDEPIFYLNPYDDTVRVGRYDKRNDDDDDTEHPHRIVSSVGTWWCLRDDDIKKFDPLSIGLSWKDI